MAERNWSFVYGQSLGKGAFAVPQLSADPYISDYTKKIASNGTYTNLVMDGSYEQPMRAMAEQLDLTGRYALWNTTAEGGKTYDQLKKGTVYYERAIDLAEAVVDANPTDDIVCRAIHWIHGENNTTTDRAIYAGYMDELLSDYETDIKAITGQTEDMHLFLCQIRGSFEAAWGQFLAFRNDPYKNHLVCPKYQMPTLDGVHVDAISSHYLGEYHGRVHRQVLIENKDWYPLCLRSITQTGAREILVRLHVPTPPVQIRSDLGVAHQNTAGFIVLDSTGVLNPTASVYNSDTIKLSFGRDLTGTPRVTYQTGNVVDSDPYRSTFNGHELPNWLVLFREFVGFNFELPFSKLKDTNRRTVKQYSLTGEDKQEFAKYYP